MGKRYQKSFFKFCVGVWVGGHPRVTDNKRYARKFHIFDTNVVQGQIEL